MTTLILSYDNENDLLYLCDGTNGYVYNPNLRSMVKGAPNVSGIHYSDGTTYVVAPAAVTVPAFSMKTAVVDFENRKEKTIFSVEIGTTLTVAIQVRIHWRELHTDSFSQTPWATFTDRGFAYLPCYGVDFQFELSAASAQALKQIDYIKINGVLHGFSYLDTSQSERWGTVT
jgi:hypothetical protein